MTKWNRTDEYEHIFYYDSYVYIRYVYLDYVL